MPGAAPAAALVATVASAAAGARSSQEQISFLASSSARRKLHVSFTAVTPTNVRDALMVFGGSNSLTLIANTYLIPKRFPAGMSISDASLWVVYESDDQLKDTVDKAAVNMEPWGFGQAFRIVPTAAGTGALTPIQNTYKASYRSWVLPSTHTAPNLTGTDIALR
jgi:hypothetical protein